METVKNAFLAPFSESAAGATTPAKTAVVYGVAGLVIGMFFLGK